MPHHPKTSEFLQQGLFSGLSTFSELENRIITNIEVAHSRGMAFEVFAVAYLKTIRRHEVDEIWPADTAPAELLIKHGISLSDHGVDGVWVSSSGELSAYQVKFRADRPSLSWSSDRVSNLFGQTDGPGIHQRAIFTNCDSIADVVKQRRDYFSIRGSDLDRLERKDFEVIETWLKTSVVRIEPRRPRAHQAEALEVLLPAFKTHDRLSAILACGTGKTLLTLWVAEKLGSKTVLVLLPSLALLRQTLHEWLRYTTIPSLAYYCICSDASVTKDADSISTEQHDLDFVVSTEPEGLRVFLDKPFSGVKLVFCTYQSAAVVGEAMKAGEQFELGIFDEAHKTAGRQGRKFQFALDDANIAIAKRLFVTATPRRYNPHERENGESALVCSMDNEALYGPNVFKLPFRRAVREGIICGYKVIISIIDSMMVSEHQIRHGTALVGDDVVVAKQVANQIAVQNAVEKHGLRKVFTFHKTVREAESFVCDGPEGIKTHLPRFNCYHVSGSMPTAKRERNLKEFAAADFAIVSNARCLTEGVDVPAVDMVAFLSPKRSEVEIVQAAGRAMRTSGTKTTGYILVPIFLDRGHCESIEEAVHRADFGDIWEVLESLQEEDDVLEGIIRDYGEAQGRAKGFDDTRLVECIEFAGNPIDLPILQKAVSTKCLERLVSGWDVWYGKLAAFKERSGNCNVKIQWEEDPELGAWVSSQRTRYSKGLLARSRIDRLNALGFDWDYQQNKSHDTWMRRFEELKAFTAENDGNPNISRYHPNKLLAHWVMTQRGNRKKMRSSTPPDETYMTLEQEQLLEELGIDWNPADDEWQRKFVEMQEFMQAQGHSYPSEVEPINKALDGWARKQRSDNDDGTILADRKAQLDGIHFEWISPVKRKWHNNLNRLRAYFEQYQDSNVPNKWPEDPKLASWVSHQRARRKKDELTEEEIHLLDELKFTWASRERGTWEDNIELIKEFIANYGHCEISTNYPENPKLGRFVNNVRSQKNRGALPAERIAELDQLGFSWGANSKGTVLVGDVAVSSAWKMCFDELCAYKEKNNGDCDVPTKYPENPKLGNWVSQQRQERKRGTLKPERESMLTEIGFRW